MNDEITELGFTVDDSYEETKVEIPKKEMPRRKAKNARVMQDRQEQVNNEKDTQLINCLRNERITIRHVNKVSGMVTDPRHALYGGMAETATRTFVVPVLSSGVYKNVLTDEEKAFLEEVMGLEYNALSVYKKENNFWDSSNDNSVSKVTLGKSDNFLDLSNPEDYIRYKILLANKDLIAPSMQELEDHPKATYQYVIVSEGEENKNMGIKLSAKKQCYKELGKISDSAATMRFVIETIERKPVATSSKIEFLEAKADELITADSKGFLKVITDPLLNTKVLLKQALEGGLIGKRGDYYYLKDGTPMCEMNEDPTFNAAARYLNSPKHQEVKLTLEAQLK